LTPHFLPAPSLPPFRNFIFSSYLQSGFKVGAILCTTYTSCSIAKPRIFQNISQSEQTHTDLVKTLIDGFGWSDPASGVVGKFTNPNLQMLYNDLIVRGSRSLAEALKVGAAIEEIDIRDLQTRMAQTNNADIQQVFNSLLNGSYNHI